MVRKETLWIIIALVGFVGTTIVAMLSNQPMNILYKTVSLVLILLTLIFFVLWWRNKHPKDMYGILTKNLELSVALMLLTVAAPVSAITYGTKIAIDQNILSQIDSVLIIAASIVIALSSNLFTIKSKQGVRSIMTPFYLLLFLAISFSLISLEFLGYANSGPLFMAQYLTNYAIFSIYLTFGVVISLYEYKK
ncbi:MAG: hypothetical protein KGH69_01740 [Candidatus Micrarchaeota archaeon]|nr:hypothetical protein [Candidatus Micrarchaeota archaeon]